MELKGRVSFSIDDESFYLWASFLFQEGGISKQVPRSGLGVILRASWTFGDSHRKDFPSKEFFWSL